MRIGRSARCDGVRRVGLLLLLGLTVLFAGCAANKPGGPSTIAPPIAADAAPSAEATRTRDFGGEDAPYAIVKVFYATDRAKTGEATPNDRYGPTRGKLVYGVADISIPRDHRMGTLEGPAISKLEFRENPESHVVLLAVAERDRSTFFRELAREEKGTGPFTRRSIKKQNHEDKKGN